MKTTIKFTMLCISAATISACGGGGSSGTDSVTQVPVANPNAFPSTLPSSGDWFVYTSSTNPTLPTTSIPSERTVTRTYRIVNSDGSLTRADTTSTFNTFGSRAFNTAAGLVSYTAGTLLCNYAPAFRSGPSLTSVVGDSYINNSVESCATQPSGTPTTNSLSASSNSQTIESRNIPLGTFDTFKYIQTIKSTTATVVTTTTETCWIDKTTGRTVDCTGSYSTTPIGQASPTSSGTTSFRLEAYSFKGQAPIGAAVRRFSGYWSVTFAGTSTGDCANLLTDINGQISGTCRFLTSAGIYAPSFTVTGSVSATGLASLTATTGASLSGTFTSPGAANGTWANGAASGAWTAVHI